MSPEGFSADRRLEKRKAHTAAEIARAAALGATLLSGTPAAAENTPAASDLAAAAGIHDIGKQRSGIRRSAPLSRPKPTPVLKQVPLPRPRPTDASQLRRSPTDILRDELKSKPLLDERWRRMRSSTNVEDDRFYDPPLRGRIDLSAKSGKESANLPRHFEKQLWQIIPMLVKGWLRGLFPKDK